MTNMSTVYVTMFMSDSYWFTVILIQTELSLRSSCMNF